MSDHLHSMTRAFHIALLSLGLMLTLGACDKAPPCASAENCPPDSACVLGACQLRECFSNSDCAIEKTCEADTGQCVAGCETEADCRYGDTCEEGRCRERGCRSTETDCSAGEYCDVATGECFEASAPHCKPCETNETCGGGDSICGRVSGEGPFCLLGCDASRPCPAGYSCVPLTRNGEIYSYNCLTLCHIVNGLEDDGRMMSISPEAIEDVGGLY